MSTVSSGVTSSGLTLNALSPTMTVLSGGTTVGITLNAGGNENLSGGTASGTVANAAYLLAPQGLLTVLSGGTSISAVLHGGVENISSGGTARATLVSSGGTETVLSGGNASGTVVISGGADVVSAGGTAVATVVSSGGVETVSSGGEANGTVVSAGGVEIVLSGGTASGAVVSSGGVETVSSGGTASGTVVSNGGNVIVSSGGAASGVVVGNGGTVTYAGGSIVGATLNAGAVEAIVSATVSGLVVSSGVTLALSSGGVASAAVIGSGGTLDFAGGSAINAVFNAGATEAIGNGVNLVSFSVSSGLTLAVWSGGITSASVVHSGAIEIVSSGGTASATVVSSGGTLEYAGGQIVGATLNTGASLAVASGAAVSGLAVSSGTTLIVNSGASASAVDVKTGGTLAYAGGVVTGATLEAGAIETVAGTTMSGLVASSGVTVAVLSGGTLSGAVVSNGGTLEDEGGAIVAATFQTGSELLLAGATVSSLQVSNGELLVVSSGGVASGTVVSNGGTISILAGGVASNTVVMSGGRETLVSGGGTAIGTVVALGGAIDLKAQTASGTTTSLNTTTDVLTVTNAGTATTLQLAGNTTGEYFSVATDNQGGTVLTAWVAAAPSISADNSSVGYLTDADPNANPTITALASDGGAVAFVAEYGAHGEEYAVVGKAVGNTYISDPNAVASTSWFAGTVITALSADGTTVAGYFQAGNGFENGFVETAGVYTTLDAPNGADGTWITAISADGTTVAGTYDDGNYMHGFVQTAGVYTTLNDPNTAGGTSITALSADGTTVAGTYDDANGNLQSFVEKAGVYTTVSDPNAGSLGTFINAISADGATVAGTYDDANGLAHGFIETAGVYTTLDAPNATNGTLITAISADGTTVAGSYGTANHVQKGFVETAGTYETIMGASTITGTGLIAMSADGTVLVGSNFLVQMGPLTTVSEAPVDPFASASIADPNIGATDMLSITLAGGGGTLADGTGFNGLVDTAGTYTLSGTASAINAELAALVFTPTAGAAGTSATTTFTLIDTSSVFATPATNSKTAVIDTDPLVAPTITGALAQTTTSEAPVAPFSAVTIADRNAGATDTLTITQSGGGTLVDGAGFSGLVGSAGTYTLSGTASAITAELDALTFTPAPGAPATTATTNFTLSDASSAFATPATDRNTTVTDVDPSVQPTITGAVQQTTTSEAPVQPFQAVVIADSNVGATDTLTITLFGNRGGTLADGQGFHGLVAGSGSYTLSGTASAITAELGALIFTPTAGAPNTVALTTFTLTDTSSLFRYSVTNNNAAVGDVDLGVAPTITGTGAHTTTFEAQVPLFTGVTITDVNALATDTLTITLSGSGGTLADGFGYSGLVDTAGTYTLSGTASWITGELDMVVFTPTAGAIGTTGTTNFTLSDTSGALGLPTTLSTESVTNNDPGVTPTITGTNLHTTTSEAAVTPFAGEVSVAITDPNAGATDTLTITQSGNGGTLVDGTGFSGLVGTAGTYTLSGTASGISAELDALVFTPTAGAPNTSSVTTFSLSDVSTAFATPVANGLTTVTDIDPPAGLAVPEILGSTLAQTTTSEAAATPFGGLTIVDGNVGATETVYIQAYNADYSPSDGTLSDGAGYHGLVDYYGQYSLTGTVSAVTAELNALVFTPTAGYGPNVTNTTTFDLIAASSVGTQSDDIYVTLSNIDPAVAPSIVGATSLTETSETLVTPFANVSINDNNIGATDTLTVTMAGSGGLLGDGFNFFGSGLTHPAVSYTLSGSYDAISYELDHLLFMPTAGAAGTSNTTNFTLTLTSNAFATPIIDSTTTVTNVDPVLTPPTPAKAVITQENVAGYTRTGLLTLTGIATAGSTVSVFDGSTALGATAIANAVTGAYSVTLSTALIDGAHSLDVTATVAGNASLASATTAVIVDTHAPSAPTAPTGAGGIVFSGTAEAGSLVTLYDGTTAIGTASANSQGAYAITLAAALSVATHSLTATATDAAGNISVPSTAAAFSYTVETLAQAIAAKAAGKLPANVIISDTATHLLAASPASLALGGVIELAGDNTVTAAQAAALAQLPGYAVNTKAVLHVIDTTANMLNPANSAGEAIATYDIAANGVANIVTAAQLTALSDLPGFGTQTGQSTPVTLIVSDTAADIAANQTAVSKYATTTISTGANPIDLTTQASGTSFALTITGGGTTTGTTVRVSGTLSTVFNLGADNIASVSAGLSAAKMTFINTPDLITLGTSLPAQIDYALQPSSGVEEISQFQYGLDHLVIDLKGAAAGVLMASNTTVNGAAAISLYSSADPTHGVILLSSNSLGSAASLMSSHVSIQGGIATIN